MPGFSRRALLSSVSKTPLPPCGFHSMISSLPRIVFQFIFYQNYGIGTLKLPGLEQRLFFITFPLTLRCGLKLASDVFDGPAWRGSSEVKRTFAFCFRRSLTEVKQILLAAPHHRKVAAPPPPLRLSAATAAKPCKSPKSLKTLRFSGSVATSSKMKFSQGLAPEILPGFTV